MLGGFSLAEVWAMTPRQTQAFLSLADEQRRRDQGDMLAIHALAAGSGGRSKEDVDAINKQMKQLSDDLT